MLLYLLDDAEAWQVARDVSLVLRSLTATSRHLMLNFALSKLYTNSLMSSLNGRKGWQYSDSKQETSGMTQSRERGTRRVRCLSHPSRVLSC